MDPRDAPHTDASPPPAALPLGYYRVPPTRRRWHWSGIIVVVVILLVASFVWAFFHMAW